MATRDKIDPMRRGLVNFVQYAWGADLYHCRYCRVQFYDVRNPVAPEVREKADAAASVAAAQVGEAE